MAIMGTLHYVNKTVDDEGNTVYVSDMLPAQSQAGDVFLNAANQRYYTVDEPVVVGGVTLIGLTPGDFAENLGYPTWDQTVPSTGDDAVVDTFPDASYFGIGPVALSRTPSYVWIDGGGKVRVVSAADLVVQESYAAIATAGKTVAPVAVGAAPAEPFTIDALFAVQGERNVVAIDAYTSTQKEEILKFYNILDDNGNLTALGAGIATRIKANEADEPEDNKFAFVEGELVPAAAWTEAPFSQVVEFESGANWSVGFYPGRNPDDPTDEVAFADEFEEDFS